MTSHLLTFHESDLLQKSNVSPLRRGFETAAGPLILHSFCPPALVASLKAERGLHAFAHFPEREHQLLLGIAERPDCALTLAYTPGGEIVGQVTLAPADPWW
jgi:acetoin utilization protein AcuC